MTATTTWRKLNPNPSSSTSLGMAPTGRRGHTAVLYGDAMHIYGGYQDLRGSSSELWTFDFSKFYWLLLHLKWVIASTLVSDTQSPFFVFSDIQSWLYARLSSGRLVLSVKSIAITLYTDLCSDNLWTISLVMYYWISIAIGEERQQYQ